MTSRVTGISIGLGCVLLGLISLIFSRSFGTLMIMFGIAILVFSIRILDKPIRNGNAGADLTSGVITLKVVGVSFTNGDGSSRQKIISKMVPGEAIVLKPYFYKGDKAVGVYNSRSEMIGNISAELSHLLYI